MVLFFGIFVDISFKINNNFNIPSSNNDIKLKNQYKNSTWIINIELDLIYQLEENHMVELSLEILFWLILLIYIGARFTKAKKGYRQQQY